MKLVHLDDRLLQVVKQRLYHSVQTMSTIPPEVANHWENWDLNEGRTNGNTGVKTSVIIDPWRAASVRSGRSIVSQEEEELLENTELTDVWKAEFQARHQTYPEHGTIGVSNLRRSGINRLNRRVAHRLAIRGSSRACKEAVDSIGTRFTACLCPPL
jgi:hypothetical protein